MSDNMSDSRAIVPYGDSGSDEPESSIEEKTDSRQIVPVNQNTDIEQDSDDHTIPEHEKTRGPVGPPGTRVFDNNNNAPAGTVQFGDTKQFGADNLPDRTPGTRKLDTDTYGKGKVPDRIQFLVRESGQVMEISTTGPIMIGRRNSTMPVDVDLADFKAQDMGVSRNHLLIESTGTRIYARDMNSVNGSRLNGERMKPLTNYDLSHGDELKLGLIHIKLYFIY